MAYKGQRYPDSTSQRILHRIKDAGDSGIPSFDLRDISSSPHQYVWYLVRRGEPIISTYVAVLGGSSLRPSRYAVYRFEPK